MNSEIEGSNEDDSLWMDLDLDLEMEMQNGRRRRRRRWRLETGSSQPAAVCVRRSIKLLLLLLLFLFWVHVLDHLDVACPDPFGAKSKQFVMSILDIRWLSSTTKFQSPFVMLTLPRPLIFLKHHSPEAAPGTC